MNRFLKCVLNLKLTGLHHRGDDVAALLDEFGAARVSFRYLASAALRTLVIVLIHGAPPRFQGDTVAVVWFGQLGLELLQFLWEADRVQ